MKIPAHIGAYIDSESEGRADAEWVRIMSEGKDLVELLIKLDPNWTVTEQEIYRHLLEKYRDQVEFEVNPNGRVV